MSRRNISRYPENATPLFRRHEGREIPHVDPVGRALRNLFDALAITLRKWLCGSREAPGRSHFVTSSTSQEREHRKTHVVIEGEHLPKAHGGQPLVHTSTHKRMSERLLLRSCFGGGFFSECDHPSTTGRRTTLCVQFVCLMI